MPKLAFFSACLLAAMAALSFTAPATAGTPLPNGDVNDDGVANAVDAALVLQYQAGFISEAPPNSDVNLDSRKSSVDAALILQYSAGLIKALPRAPIPPIDSEPTVTASGLTIYEIEIGNGTEAQEDGTVTVDYTGWLQNGTTVDSSTYGRGPVQFALTSVIRGWREGVPGMKVGGVRRLVIPPDLAYGKQGNGDIIPPNATLIFDIELISVP